MKKREAGERHGCKDTSPPETCSPYQLSRVLDALDLFDDAQLPKQAMWDSLPYGLRMDFNYAKWSYEPVAEPAHV